MINKMALLICLILLKINVSAQTCKIKIFYDNNGNRIQRSLECQRPAPPEDPAQALATKDDSPGGLNELESRFQVYPNPAESKINVQLSPNALKQRCSIVLTDITGKTLYQSQQISKALTAIDLGGFADGTYFIILLRDNHKDVVKIVKQTGNGY